MSKQIPNLYPNISQSPVVAYQHAAVSQDHPRFSLNINEAFFSKRFKTMSRSKTPFELRSQSAASMYPVSTRSDSPRSPMSFATSMLSPDRPLSYWDPADSASPTSPRWSAANGGPKNRGIFRKSFSPAAPITKSRSTKTSPTLEEEFDPTTLRKNRTRPKEGTDPMYYGYDDLFRDDDNVTEETHSAAVTGINWNEPDYSFFLNNYEQEGRDFPSSQFRPLSTGPRSVAPQLSSYSPSIYESPNPASLAQGQWRRPGHRASTPPLSKPPSMTELLPSDNALFSLPPTPPAKSQEQSPALSTSEFLSQASAIVEALQTVQVPSPGPPPVCTPPPVPPSTGGSDSVRETERKQLASQAGLGISNVLVDFNLLEPIEAEIASKGFDAVFEDVSDCIVAPLFSKSRRTLEENSKDTIFNGDKMKAVEEKIVAGTEHESHQGNALYNSLDREPKRASETNQTGFTPQMRIVDFRDVDAEFAIYSPYTAPPSPPMDTMKHVLFAETHDDTMKEVVMDQSYPTAETSQLPEDSSKGIPPDKDATYLRVFRNYIRNSGENDAFIQRQPRFDALQAQRICSYLRKDFPLIPSKKPVPHADCSSQISRIIKQREVGEELCTSLWALMALRWLNSGRVLSSPAHDILLAASAKRLTKRLTIKGDQRTTEMLEGMEKGKGDDGERRRVLDLGGQPIADWGWHCAYDYPKSKVYTVSVRQTKLESEENPQVSGSGTGSEDLKSQQETAKCRGPKNHRHITVSYLWRLPFPDSHFDAISARTLYTLLKTNRHASRSRANSASDGRGRTSTQQILDEYDLCLEECFRVLKPGGYLEFFIFDADLIRAGPEGQALSRDFTSQLSNLGYDPSPTTRWISRLNKAGYRDIKRGWLFCPMAPPEVKPKVPSKQDEHSHKRNRSTGSLNKEVLANELKEELRRKMEAWDDPSTKRGTIANVASISGLLGSWVWEKWMLKANAEAKKTNEWELAIDRMGAVLEEGRESGSGWRVLAGWARKPVAH